MNDRRFEKELDALEEAYEQGELSTREYNFEMRDLEQEYYNET